jgi:ferric-dicitrate binding protein FerR (iron transport regulator)
LAALAACLLALAAIGIALNRSSAPPRAAEVRVRGNGVQVMRGGTLIAGGTIEVQAGDIITTSTNESAVLAYEHESTRVEIFPGTVVFCGDASAGKNFELRCGGMQAQVAPQTTGEPMLITTPQARATVLGTRFIVRADERATKIDVFEGKVELAGLANAQAVMVKAGYWASATASGLGEVKQLCKCPKCRGTNEPSNCPNLKKKNEN